nr:hypothetical protein [Actinomyces sp.]
MDLTDLWRGRLSMRRALVLIRGLPPGAGLFRRHGGDMAWSPEERAVREAGYQILTGLLAIRNLFTKKAHGPLLAPSPPPEGWWEAEQEAVARTRRKVARVRRAGEHN